MAKARISNICNSIRGGCAVQVVLPLLDSAVVEPGWISEPDFLTGIALVQAMPEPLFNIVAYVGKRSALCHGRSNCNVWFEPTGLFSCCCSFCAAAALVVPLLIPQVCCMFEQLCSLTTSSMHSVCVCIHAKTCSRSMNCFRGRQVLND